MKRGTTRQWANMRTDESRTVEDALREKFPTVDAYRYNSASIRVRVIDPRFEGKSVKKRDAMVEPLLKKLPENIQSDIMNLLTLYPGETEHSLRALSANVELEEPSDSML